MLLMISVRLRHQIKNISVFNQNKTFPSFNTNIPSKRVFELTVTIFEAFVTQFTSEIQLSGKKALIFHFPSHFAASAQ